WSSDVCSSDLRSTASASVRDSRETLEFLELMLCLDVSNGSRLRAHHHRIRGRSVGPVLHAAEQRAIRHTGRREEHLSPRDEVVVREYPIEIEPLIEQRSSLLGG